MVLWVCNAAVVNRGAAGVFVCYASLCIVCVRVLCVLVCIMLVCTMAKCV